MSAATKNANQAEDQAETGFTSLAALQYEHAQIQAEIRKKRDEGQPADGHQRTIEEVIALDAAIASRLNQLVHKAVLTGVKLDHPDDRQSAQGIINCWISRAVPAASTSATADNLIAEPEFDSLLADFDPTTLSEATAAVDRWLESNDAAEALARTIVLRLMRLRDDDKFEPVSATTSIYDDLGPPEAAREVVNKLAKLGIVRFTADDAGRRAIALCSFDLLHSWPRLQKWQAERREFRSLANAWSRTAEQGTAVTQTSYARFNSACERATLRIGDWLMQCALKVFVPLGLWSPSKDIFDDNRYEEAETYRDMNAIELKLVYQKRQLDRQELESRQARATVFAFAMIVSLVLLVVALYLLGVVNNARGIAVEQKAIADTQTAAALKAKENVEEEKEKAETARKQSELTVASLQFEKSAELPLTNQDRSGSLLFQTVALASFDETAMGRDPIQAERNQLRKSYLLGVGINHRQISALSALAYHPDGDPRTVAASSLNGEVALTVGAEESSEKSDCKLVARIWRRVADGTWQPEELTQPLDKKPVKLSAYLNFDGRVGAVVVQWDERVELYSLIIPTDQGSFQIDRAPEKFTGDGKLGDAKFSPEGNYFGIVMNNTENVDGSKSISKLKSKTTRNIVTVWNVKASKWETCGPEDGAVACIALSDEPARVAVVLGSETQTKTVCLEWTIGGALAPSRYDVETLLSDRPSTTDNREVTFATYGPKSSHLLFVARTQRGQTANCAWIFNTDKHTNVALSDSFGGAESSRITHAAFNPWGNRLATGGDDGKVTLWKVQGESDCWVPYYRRPAHSEQVFYTSFSSDGNQLVTASRDRTALVHNALSGELLYSPIRHSGSVTGAVFAADGREVVTVSTSAVYRWVLPALESRPQSFGIPVSGGIAKIVTCDALDSSASHFVLGGSEGNEKGWLGIWNFESAGAQKDLHFASPVQHISIAPQHSLICATMRSGAITVLNREAEIKWEQPTCEQAAVFTAFAKRGNDLYLAVLEREFQNVTAGVSSLRVFLIDPISGKGKLTELEFETCAASLSGLVVSPMGDYVAGYSSGIGPGWAAVWDLSTGKCERLLRDRGSAHREPILHAKFSATGLQLVTTSSDDSTIIWERKEGNWTPYLFENQEGDQIINHTADVLAADFATKGERVVTASSDGRAIVWEWNNRYEPIIQLKPESSQQGVTKVEFIDESTILTLTADGTLWLWYVDLDRRKSHLIGTHKHPQSVRHFCRTKNTGGTGVFSVGWNQIAQLPVAHQLWLGVIMTTEWRLEPFDEKSMSVDDVSALAKIAAAREIFQKQDPLRANPLSLVGVNSLWQKNRNSASGSPASEELISWHLSEATACECAIPPDWRGARWHWNKVIDLAAAHNSKADFFARRALVHSELQSWDESNRDFALAEKATAAVRNPSYLNTYGTTLYRANKFDEAIKQLESATKLRQQLYLDSDSKTYGDVLDLLFIAMANHRLWRDKSSQANRDASLTALESAISKIKQYETTPKNDQSGVAFMGPFWNRLEIDIIRREAENLISPTQE
ncbi:hypothetical protein [Anatilimnocola floriformis]|uniref:hypothetical protein n=1 Tax=Anatilimnocola floriformis TaxID=2948575 RepID=UPI0020C36A6A|nr:hypothetical protein [Anatilimnocola floriformis]